jgi:hypothetical protein
MSTPNASILDLPHELLLPIAEHLIVEPRYDRSPYGDLTALATAHRHFTNVVRSTIHSLETPSVPLPKAHALFRTLRDFPMWAIRFKSIEITNYASPEGRPGNYGGSENGCIAFPKDNAWERKLRRKLRDGGLAYKDAKQHSKMPSRQFDFEFVDKFREECIAIVQDPGVNVSNTNKQAWEDALRAGHVLAFLALLVAVLPNLDGLFLGAGHILHYPMLLRNADPQEGPMAPWSPVRRHWNNNPSNQQLRGHKYPGQVFQRLYSQLTKLEMPSSWTTLWDAFSSIAMERAWKVHPRYRHFTSLQTLVIPEYALSGFSPVENLPHTLESLTMVDCTGEALGHTLTLFYFPPTPHSLPNIRHISMYFTGTDDVYDGHFDAFRQKAQPRGITFSEYSPKN